MKMTEEEKEQFEKDVEMFMKFFDGAFGESVPLYENEQPFTAWEEIPLKEAQAENERLRYENERLQAKVKSQEDIIKVILDGITEVSMKALGHKIKELFGGQ